MKPTLREYAVETRGEDFGYSQFEEAAMLDVLLQTLGVGPKEDWFVVEFGASTGPALSNTWHLAEAGAEALYIEADHDKWLQLSDACVRLLRASALRHTVDQIDLLLTKTPTIMSIDVDGEDYEIFQRMTVEPPIVIIEHNPMIPLHVDFVGGQDVGASALAIHKLAVDKGYVPVGMTNCNSILVRDSIAGLEQVMNAIEWDPRAMFDPSQITFAISNVKTGDYTMHGPWPFGRGEEL